MEDKDGNYRLDLFNALEKRIFIIFLKHENLRHMKDIVNINKTIRELE